MNNCDWKKLPARARSGLPPYPLNWGHDATRYLCSIIVTGNPLTRILCNAPNVNMCKSIISNICRSTLAMLSPIILVLGCSTSSPENGKDSSTPALDVLSRFTAADVPGVGPAEIPIDPPGWKVSPPDIVDLPGNRLAQHPMLYIGEGCNRIFIINQGKVIWTYDTGKGWEYDDAWLLSNGNVLFSRMSYAAEVTPEKQVVWRLDAPVGTEIHTVQPIGLDKVLLMENGRPARLLVVNTKTAVVEVNHAMPYSGPGVHAEFRRVRMTASGTYLVPYLELGKVVEYDKHFNEVWSYNIPSPWAAIRLHNGNTLITDEREALTREVDPGGKMVWEFKLGADVPPGIRFFDSQSCVRLANGNTVLCSRGNAGKGCQLIEVTPDKKVIWALKDWTDLGPASAVQMLDDPGIPEKPGDLQR
ncbi:MAG: hypothetical protein ABSE48_16570 [Verrucomicrobiota bacterium]